MSIKTSYKSILNLGSVGLISSVFLLTSGCASSPKISYTDPNAIQTTSIDYSSTDLQSITNGMVDSMLTMPRVEAITAKSTPVLFISGMQNNSNQMIDTQALTNAISTRLINSGKFNFVDMSQVDAVKNQMNYQHQSGMVDPSTAAALGKQVGAQYMLYGDISSISQRNDSEQTLYLQVTMKLLDIQSGLIVWQGEKQISKAASKKGFGW